MKIVKLSFNQIYCPQSYCAIVYRLFYSFIKIKKISQMKDFMWKGNDGCDLLILKPYNVFIK